MTYNVILILSVILTCLFLWCRYWRHIEVLMQRCWIFLGKRCSQPAFQRYMHQFQHHGCCTKVWKMVSIFIYARVDSGLSLKYHHAYSLAIKYISFIRRICHTCVIIMHIKIKKTKSQGLYFVLHISKSGILMQQFVENYVFTCWSVI